MLLLLNAKLVTIDVVLKIPRRKKSCPGYNGPGRWMTSPSRVRICGERKEEGSEGRFARLEKASKINQIRCLVKLRRRSSRWWRMRLVAGPSLKVVLWKRVHRVENWVSNLFKYYFFFFSRSPLDWQAVRAVFEKEVGSAVVGSVGGWVCKGRGASE
jgi:hypothetical protein